MKKEFVLQPGMDVIPEEVVHISGTASMKLRNLGTTQVEMKSKQVTFQVVPYNVPIESGGILGREYLREEKAEISFWHNSMVTHSNPINPFFFSGKESLRARKALTESKANKNTNTKLKEGYLPLIKTVEGVIIGEGVVTNRDGKCHILSINTTSED